MITGQCLDHKLARAHAEIGMSALGSKQASAEGIAAARLSGLGQFRLGDWRSCQLQHSGKLSRTQ